MEGSVWHEAVEGPAAPLPKPPTLTLAVRDPELVPDLDSLGADDLRDEYALRTLLIGMPAIKQAQGALDVEAIRRESDAIQARLRETLDAHRPRLETRAQRQVAAFDPFLEVAGLAAAQRTGSRAHREACAVDVDELEDALGTAGAEG